MFEEYLLDEEIKKKKRRVLIGLFILLLLGTIAAFPLAGLFPLSAPPVPEAAADTPTRTATGVPAPGVTATATSPSEATPQPTATVAVAHVTPTVTEETAGGFGGGTLMTPTASPTATSTPPALATPTSAEPGQLPVTGADGSRGLSWLILGLAVILLGTLMMGAGCALCDARPRQ